MSEKSTTEETANPDLSWAQGLMTHINSWCISLEPIPCAQWTAMQRLSIDSWQFVNWNFLVGRCRARRGEKPLFRPTAPVLVRPC